VRMVDISSAESQADAIERLKERLPFPAWCGSSWDSIEDAFTEIQHTWPFPLALVVEGLPSLLRGRPHTALEFVIRMSQISAALSQAGKQLIVVYVTDESP
jgi:hypothetical protein